MRRELHGLGSSSYLSMWTSSEVLQAVPLQGRLDERSANLDVNMYRCRAEDCVVLAREMELR